MPQHLMAGRGKIQRKQEGEAKGKGDDESGKEEKGVQDGTFSGWPQVHKKSFFTHSNGTSLRGRYTNPASPNSPSG